MSEPLLITFAVDTPNEPTVLPVPTCKVPLLSVVLPLYLLLFVKVNWPLAAGLTVKEPKPLMTPLIVAAMLLKVRVLAPVVVKVLKL